MPKARSRLPLLRLARAAVAAATVLAASGTLHAPVFARAAAEEGSLAEFESVCSQTQDAMSLTSDELRALVRRCDGLKPWLEALEPSRRKVYQRRLQLCRDLYQFVLDSRGQE